MRWPEGWIRGAGALSVLAFLLLATPSSAIVADPRPRTCAAFSSADVVVAGHIGAARLNLEWVRWDVTVDRLYKGTVPKRFQLYTPNDSSRATPDDGKRNLLFITRRNGRLEIGGSDPNGSDAAARRIEAEVAALAARPRTGAGSIRLLVASEQGVPLGGARVRLHRSGAPRDLIVRTDKQGFASLNAAPGRWTALLVEPGWTSRFSLYTYDRADGFTLRPGGCADLRLEPVRQMSKK